MAVKAVGFGFQQGWALAAASPGDRLAGCFIDGEEIEAIDDNARDLIPAGAVGDGYL